jgi:cell division septal protein FtsQ
MTGLSRLRACAAVVLVALCIPLALPAVSGAAASTYTKESKQALEAQLAKRQITAAAVNHTVGTVRLTLKDGRHFLYHYAAGGQQATETQLRSHGVAISEVKTKHKKKSKSLGSHPRRTIAIIVVVVLVLAGLVFLLLRRRRIGRD